MRGQSREDCDGWRPVWWCVRQADASSAVSIVTFLAGGRIPAPSWLVHVCPYHQPQAGPHDKY